MKHPTPSHWTFAGHLFSGLILVSLLLPCQPLAAQIEQSWYQLTLGASVNLHTNLGKRAFRNNFPVLKPLSVLHRPINCI
ncbi:MAG: hypothetical protein IPJ06_02125 [Saprospiraceae bacterium]|nr:hypothetical protein [Saprospiraceae bacterium]